MNYLILGASAAGLSAVKAIRQSDGRGNITVLSPDRFIYSRCLLPDIISGSRDATAARFVPVDFMEKFNVRWFGGVKATGLLAEEKTVMADTGDSFYFDKLLIATGASAFLPPVENIRRAHQVYSLRNLEDAGAIIKAAERCRQVVVMGGGLIGVDIAIALNEKGLSVTIVEAAAHILPLQLDQKAAVRYEDIILERGIDIITGEMATKIMLDGKENVTGVQLKSSRVVPCGMVASAAGVRPNVSFLEGTTVDVGRGVRVNEYQDTSLQNIYAAGDVCESFEAFSGQITTTPIWPLAVLQGRVAGYNMAGTRRRLANNFAYRNSMHFYGLPTVSFGLTSAPGPGYDTYTEEQGGCYKKFILKDGCLRGAIIQGDIAGAGVFGALIRESIPVSGLNGQLSDISYADFFNQQEDGGFVYSSNLSG